MNHTKSVILSAIILMLGTISYGGNETPEELAKQYFNALQEEGMTAMGKFMHPDALEELKVMLLEVFETAEAGGGSEIIQKAFGDSASISDIKQMDAQAFFNAFINILTASLGERGLSISFDKLEVLGTVEEDKIRHVLTRVTVGAGETAMTQMEVLSFMPYEDSWRLQLSGKIKGIINAIQARLIKN